MSSDDKFLRPRIEPLSRPKDGLSAIRECKCFQEVDRRLRLGWSPSDVARMIQDEYGECEDLGFKYLKGLVEKYRDTIPPAELAGVPYNPLVAKKASIALATGVDELEELNKLYRMQMERIEIDFQNEKRINKLFSTTGREVFVAMKILSQAAELKMDLGLTKRHMGTMEVTGQMAAEVSDRYGKDSIGKVIADPDSRRKVLGIAERLLALGAKASIDAVEIIGSTMQNMGSNEDAPDGKIIDTEAVPLGLLESSESSDS